MRCAFPAGAVEIFLRQNGSPIFRRRRAEIFFGDFWRVVGPRSVAGLSHWATFPCIRRGLRMGGAADWPASEISVYGFAGGAGDIG